MCIHMYNIYTCKFDFFPLEPPSKFIVDAWHQNIGHRSLQRVL